MYLCCRPTKCPRAKPVSLGSHKWSPGDLPASRGSNPCAAPNRTTPPVVFAAQLTSVADLRLPPELAGPSTTTHRKISPKYPNPDAQLRPTCTLISAPEVGFSCKWSRRLELRPPVVAGCEIVQEMESRCGGLWWAKVVNWVAGLESVVQNEERLPISKQKKKSLQDCDGPVTIRHKLQTFVKDCDGSVTNYDNFLICDGFSVTNFKSSVTKFIYSRAPAIPSQITVVRHKFRPKLWRK